MGWTFRMSTVPAKRVPLTKTTDYKCIRLCIRGTGYEYLFSNLGGHKENILNLLENILKLAPAKKKSELSCKIECRENFDPEILKFLLF